MKRESTQSVFVPYPARFTSRFIQPWAAHARALGLAARIQARYARRPRRVTGSDMDLLRQKTWQPGEYLHLSQNLYLALTLFQRLDYRANRMTPGMPGSRNQPVERSPVQTPRMAAAGAQAVARAAARHARVETLPNTPPLVKVRRTLPVTDQASPNTEMPLSKPIPYIVRRMAPPVVEDQADSPSQPVKPSQNKPAGTADTFSLVQPSQADINRLTEQVIQVIDRRIIAQRERSGRL